MVQVSRVSNSSLNRMVALDQISWNSVCGYAYKPIELGKTLVTMNYMLSNWDWVSIAEGVRQGTCQANSTGPPSSCHACRRPPSRTTSRWRQRWRRSSSPCAGRRCSSIRCCNRKRGSHKSGNGLLIWPVTAVRRLRSSVTNFSKCWDAFFWHQDALLLNK